MHIIQNLQHYFRKIKSTLQVEISKELLEKTI